ncbi:MAG: hypothetical protein K8S54_20320 [Spirochaetia bacterium]|nr:hypothetical protein [Spirochaetia bacterium]
MVALIPARLRYRSALAFALLMGGFIPIDSAMARSPADLADLANRFTFDGQAFVRAIALGRDISLPEPPVTSDKRKTQPSYADYYRCTLVPTYCVESRQREEQNYYTFRLNLNTVFRVNANADVLFGIEVGDLTLGRDSSSNGPGSGGRSGGATNLETHHAHVRLHTVDGLLLADIGIFSYSTPAGLVLARSGGGSRVFWKPDTIDSVFQALYFRAIDNSQVDGDSNGFSDSNYSDVHIASVSWKFTHFRSFVPELYGVYKGDGDASSSDDSQFGVRETQRMYWGGLYMQLFLGDFEFTLHGIGNWGRFSRLLAQDPGVKRVTDNPADPLSQFMRDATAPPIFHRYKTNAGAWQVEAAYQIFEPLKLTALSIGATGRPSRTREPDGSDPAYRADQFRLASGSFQLSNIAIDDSGGYSIFSGGNITGVVANGGKIAWQIGELWLIELVYLRLGSYRPIVNKYNKYYTRLQNYRDSNFLGEEWDLNVKFKAFEELKFTLNFGYFNAGSAYKSLVDAQYGDHVAEVQFGLVAEF